MFGETGGRWLYDACRGDDFEEVLKKGTIAFLTLPIYGNEIYQFYFVRTHQENHAQYDVNSAVKQRR
jgi:nucleotidyltransferase/DNA polymerase involved in DNA repair